MDNALALKKEELLQALKTLQEVLDQAEELYSRIKADYYKLLEKIYQTV